MARICYSRLGLPCGSPDNTGLAIQWTPLSSRPRLPFVCPTAFAQGSFAPEALPSFLATTSPCAEPDTSHHHFGLLLIGGVLAACAIHSWLSGPSRLSVCSSFLECCAPFAGGSSGVHDQFFPDDNGLRPDIKGSTNRFFPRTDSRGWRFRQCRHSFMLRPSSLLALLSVRDCFHSPQGRFHLSFPSIRYLLGSQVCYPADWPIAGAGLSPARRAALSAALYLPPQVLQ